MRVSSRHLKKFIIVQNTCNRSDEERSQPLQHLYAFQKLLPKKKEQRPLEEVAATKRSSGLGLKCSGLVLDRRPRDMLQKEKVADGSDWKAQTSGGRDSLSHVGHF